MTAKLTVLDTKKQASAVVVEAAKDILRMAEAGELVDIVWCGRQPDGGFMTGFTPSDDCPAQLGAVSRLQWRLCQKMDEE